MNSERLCLSTPTLSLQSLVDCGWTEGPGLPTTRNADPGIMLANVGHTTGSSAMHPGIYYVRGGAVSYPLASVLDRHPFVTRCRRRMKCAKRIERAREPLGER